MREHERPFALGWLYAYLRMAHLLSQDAGDARRMLGGGYEEDMRLRTLSKPELARGVCCESPKSRCTIRSFLPSPLFLSISFLLILQVKMSCLCVYTCFECSCLNNQRMEAQP